MEGQYAMKNNGSLLSFSEQQLMDCSRGYGNKGCKGGLMGNAFRYLETNPDEKEADYPYIAVVSKNRRSGYAVNSAHGVH